MCVVCVLGLVCVCCVFSVFVFSVSAFVTGNHSDQSLTYGYFKRVFAKPGFLPSVSGLTVREMKGFDWRIEHVGRRGRVERVGGHSRLMTSPESHGSYHGDVAAKLVMQGF